MTRFPVALTLSAVAASITTAAHADILLTIDATNPSAVVISSTTGLSAVSANDNSYQLRLMGALSAPSPNLGSFSAQSLTGVNGRGYNLMYGFSGTFNMGISGPGNQPNNFIAGTQAFSGSWTGDLSFLTFAAPGTTGEIRFSTVNAADTGIVLGQFQIVPTPGAAALLGLTGLTASRRRR